MHRFFRKGKIDNNNRCVIRKLEQQGDLILSFSVTLVNLVTYCLNSKNQIVSNKFI